MRLSTVLILFIIMGGVNAQSNQFPEKWIGLNNLFFKNKDISKTSIQFTTSGDSLLVINESLDQQLSFGISFRKINKKGGYDEFDIFAINSSKNREVSSEQLVDSPITEPLRGQESKSLRLQIGYQRGKLLPILPRLNADLGLSGSVWYETNKTTPVTSAGFPVDTRLAGVGLNVELGLNFQIIKQLNIGYSIFPITSNVAWRETTVNNPILPVDQRVERDLKFDADLFKSTFEWRNFHIRYCF